MAREALRREAENIVTAKTGATWRGETLWVIDNRTLGVNLSGTRFDPSDYDHHNGGPGAAKRAVDRLRKQAAE